MQTVSQYNPEKKILYLSITDELNLNEFADVLKKIIHSNDYSSDIGILLDITSIISPTSNGNFMQDLIETRNMFLELGEIKIAIVTNDFTFGMGNKYELLSGTMPQNVMIFDNYLEGEDWLTGKEN